MNTTFGNFFRRSKKQKEEEKKCEAPPDDAPKEKTDIRIVFIGEACIGAKTSFVYHYIHEKNCRMVEPTIGASFCTKTVTCRGREVNVQIWDTAGNERYVSLSLMYLRGADGIVVGYDITNKETYVEARQRYVRITNQLPENKSVFMLIGNKVDREEVREVTTEEGEEFVREFNIPLFFESK